MAKLYAPNGLLIVGTADFIPATANILNDNIKPAVHGRFEFDYAGGSTVHWDGQWTDVDSMTKGRIFVDEDGNQWPENELELREEGAEGADDD